MGKQQPDKVNGNDKKKETDPKVDNDSQPGTSGIKEVNKEKKVLKKKQSKEKKVKKSKEKKANLKESSPQEPTHQRRLSSTERYKISARQEGPQPSNTVRNLVPRTTLDTKNPPTQPKLRVAFNEASISDRDHHAAVDFYNRSTRYSYTRESLVNLQKPTKKESRFKLHHHHRTLAHRKLHFHVRRCMQCLQAKDECICENMAPKLPKSDWAVLVQPQIETPKTWLRPRLDWLRELEEKSTVDREKLIQENFDSNREICCCPFNTFQIFSKREIKNLNYYEKN